MSHKGKGEEVVPLGEFVNVKYLRPPNLQESVHSVLPPPGVIFINDIQKLGDAPLIQSQVLGQSVSKVLVPSGGSDLKLRPS